MTNQSTKASERIVLPGSTVGVVGGGQLGRMFAVAAAQMGFEVVVFCQSEAEPAAQVAHRVVAGDLSDMSAIEAFASQCAVITLEFENIPAETIARCAAHAPTYPAANVLATAQQRLHEKTALSNVGLPVTPFAAVDGPQSLLEAGEQLGWPMVVKTARSGYDGKGQHSVASPEEVHSVAWESASEWIAEAFISFDREVSVIVARRPDGEMQTFPLFENLHSEHILDVTVMPARVSSEVERQAREIACRAAETLGVVGLLCVEMFLCGDQLCINEVAPRPHNSGHLTIEASETSQFEQHVRAICNLPLGSTRPICGGAAMANLLGDLWGQNGESPNWRDALDTPGVRLHLYGKRIAKPRRKMGHLTATADTIDEATERVREARRRCRLRSPEPATG